MPWDLVIDPETGDFVRDGAGGWERTETGDTAIRNQLGVQFGSWWGDPRIGSLLHDRARFASDPPTLVAAELRRAFALLAADQYLADVEVTAAANPVKQGRVDARTSYRLVESGQLVDLALPKVFGG